MSYKKQLGMLLMVVFLLLSACSSNSSELTDNPDTETEQSEEGLNDGKVELTEDYADDALSVRMQLVVGSLLLENTDLAVDTVMAEKLLPYWKMYKVLAESDTKAQEEMDAVIGQIQDTMTADQLSYIVDLQITQETMLTLVSDLGINEKFISEGMKEGAGTGIDRPEGFVPGSGRGGGQDGNIDPELMATKQAAREDAGDGMMSRLTIPLVDELISLLEEKAGS